MPVLPGPAWLKPTSRRASLVVVVTVLFVMVVVVLPPRLPNTSAAMPTRSNVDPVTVVLWVWLVAAVPGPVLTAAPLIRRKMLAPSAVLPSTATVIVPPTWRSDRPWKSQSSKVEPVTVTDRVQSASPSWMQPLRLSSSTARWALPDVPLRRT